MKTKVISLALALFLAFVSGCKNPMPNDATQVRLISESEWNGLTSFYDENDELRVPSSIRFTGKIYLRPYHWAIKRAFEGETDEKISKVSCYSNYTITWNETVEIYPRDGAFIDITSDVCTGTDDIKHKGDIFLNGNYYDFNFGSHFADFINTPYCYIDEETTSPTTYSNYGYYSGWQYGSWSNVFTYTFTSPGGGCSYNTRHSIYFVNSNYTTTYTVSTWKFHFLKL